MGLKNINIFEQHVEKIVMGVAAAGALFMGYLSLQKVTIPDTEVGPNDVEQSITDEINKMDKNRDRLEAEGPPKVQVTNYVAEYQGKSSGKPLDDGLVGTKILVFAPRNVQPTPGGGGRSVDDEPKGLASVIPAPALPELVHAEALQLAVAPPQIDPVTGQAIPVPAGMQLATQTKNVVVIDGWAPVGQMVLEMLKEPDPKTRFTPEVQRGIVYRVRVLRQELQPNGQWSAEAEIAPAKGSPAPTVVYDTATPEGALPEKMTEIEGQFQQIQMPTFYVDAQGVAVQPPILTRPIPKAIVEETAKLHNDIEAAKAGAVTAGAFSRVPVPVVPAAGAVTQPAVETLGTATPDVIKAREVQPFTFWDDSVQPDHTYQYKVQLREVNPGFGWKWGLAAPAMKLEPYIPLKDEGFVPVPGAVVVHSDMAFFIRGMDYGTKGAISGRIFKQQNGRWYFAEFTAQNGMNITGQINMGPNNLKEVNTKFALVDVQQLGTNVHVILKDPSGNLVTREAPDDFRSAQNDDLYNKAKEAAAAAASQAATEPGATPVTPVNPATRRGTTPVTPPVRPPVPVRPGG